MEQWVGKVAVVTGASSGIGASICIALAKAGCIVVGLARRHEKVEELKSKILGAKGEIHAYKCDVCDETSVKDAFKWIETKFGGLCILINNAGAMRFTQILGDKYADNSGDLKHVLDTNILGTIYPIKAAYRLLHDSEDNGHIINLGSILSHYVPIQTRDLAGYNVYPGTKHAIKATTEVIRQELISLKNKRVKVSMISPGLVETGLFGAGKYPFAEKMFTIVDALQPDDIAQACLYVLGTPPHVQIQDLIIRPVGEKC